MQYSTEDDQPAHGQDRSAASNFTNTEHFISSYHIVRVHDSYIIGYCEKEITRQYDSFVRMCPEGSLSKQLFTSVSRELYGPQVSTVQYSTVQYSVQYSCPWCRWVVGHWSPFPECSH